MPPRAPLSPAWLGLFAALSFGGLVLTSFASGYHLVTKTAPRVEPAASADSPSSAEPSAVAAPQTADLPQAAAAPAEPAAPSAGARGSTDPAEAVVKDNLPPDRAVVRSQPEAGKRIARLPSKQRVSVRGRQGQWVHISFDRKGKHVDGWTLESNLQLR